MGAVFILMSQCLTKETPPLDKLMADGSVSSGRAKYSRKIEDGSMLLTVELQ